MHSRLFAIFCSFSISLATGFAHAQVGVVDASLGGASVSKDGYHNAAAFLGSFSYMGLPIKLSAGAYVVPQIRAKNGDAELDIAGLYFTAGHEFDFGSTFLDVQGGIALNAAEARLYSEVIGEDVNESGILQVGVGYHFNQWFGIRGGVTYIDDASGESLTIVQAGPRWSF